MLAGWVDAAEAIVPGVHGFDVLPATRELAGVELALAGEVSRETVLRDALDGVDYDAVVVDTPSNLGLLTVNALVAADVVVAPVAADDEGAAQGVAELRATIAKLGRSDGLWREWSGITSVGSFRLPHELLAELGDAARTTHASTAAGSPDVV